MDLADIDEFASSLDGCRQRRAGGRLGWYVNGLLMVRPDSPGTVLVRVTPAEREQLLADLPTTFGVPPRWEAHEKVQAFLDGDPDGIRRAITLAWQRQRTR